MLRLLLSSTFNMSRTLSRRLVVSSRTGTSVGQQLRGFAQLVGPNKAPCVLSLRRRQLQTSRQFHLRQIASAGSEALAEQQYEPGAFLWSFPGVFRYFRNQPRCTPLPQHHDAKDSGYFISTQPRLSSIESVLESYRRDDLDRAF